jgi:peptidoglycan/LPS O-acetylase OafA/YrhL
LSVTAPAGAHGERRSAIPHVAALDGARGAAVAAVLVFHGGHLLGGYLGVDFFFTLSGFLITSLLLAESARTGGVGLGGFWARRARRLLPALAVLMLGVALFCVTIATPAQLTQIRGDALATLAYGANWREVYARQDYWSIFAAPSPLNHTWSLAIEEQFYVIWPLVFVGLLAWFKRGAAKAVLATSLALAAVSSVLMFTLYDPASSARVYFGTDTRAAAILFGAALAAALAVRGAVSSRRGRVALETVGLSGAAVLAIAWTHLDGQSSTLYRGGFLLCGLAATAVIAAAVHPQPGLVSRVLSFKPLCLLGIISYGVYLYHWPLDIVLDQQRVGLRGWPLFLVQTAVTLALAVVSYRYIEQPVRRGALSSVQWPRYVPAIAIALVFLLVVTTNGASPPARAALTGPEALAAATRERQSAPPGSQRIMVVGNSVADSLGEAFNGIVTDPPLVVFNAGLDGCNFPPAIKAPPLITAHGPLDWPPCHPQWEAGVVERFRPTVVFWVVSDLVNRGLSYRGRTVSPCTAPFDALYRHSLRDEVARLGAQGARVIITTEAYDGRSSATTADDRAVDCDNAIRRDVAARTHSQLIDLFGYICPGGRCVVTQNGVTLRPDGVHYTGSGGATVAQWLIDQADRAR